MIFYYTHVSNGHLQNPVVVVFRKVWQDLSLCVSLNTSLCINENVLEQHIGLVRTKS